MAARVLAYLAIKNGGSGKGVFFITLASVAAHLSDDVFAGNGFFYILAPLSFASYEFPFWSWPPLLGVGLAFGLVARLRGRLSSSRP
jgi:hypothetical protein